MASVACTPTFGASYIILCPDADVSDLYAGVGSHRCSGWMLAEIYPPGCAVWVWALRYPVLWIFDFIIQSIFRILPTATAAE